MQNNNFWCLSKSLFFPILFFSLLLPYFAIVKVVALNLFTSFLFQSSKLIIGFCRAITIEREMKQRNYTKNEAKKIRSDNMSRSNKDTFNIAIAILED